MKKLFELIFSIILLMTWQPTVFAQSQFAKVYYQEFQGLQSGAVATTYDGGFVIAGERNDKYLLLKIDSNGDTLWNKTIFGKENYQFYWRVCLIPLKDSSLLFVAGCLNNDSTYLETLCINFNNDGVERWSKTYDFGKSTYPLSVAQTFDDGFILSGRTNGKLSLLRLDNIGQVLWVKMLEGGDQSNYGNSIKQTKDSGFIIAGNIIDNEPYLVSAVLLKLSQNGSIEWSKSLIASSNFNDGLDVIEDNGFVMAMWTGDSTILVKTDISGDVLWTKKYLPTVFVEPLFPFARLQKTDKGRFTLLSPIISYDGESDVFMELNPDGEVVWARRVDLYTVDVTNTSDDGFLIVGNGPVQTPKSPLAWEPQIGVLKTDSLGQNDSHCIYSTQIEAEAGAVLAQGVSFSSEEAEVVVTAASLQFLTSPLTVRSGCVDITGAIREGGFENAIQIYPNPISSQLTIQSKTSKIELCRIYNLSGQLLSKFEIDSPIYHANTSMLSNGIYLFEIHMKDGTILRKKILKQ